MKKTQYGWVFFAVIIIIAGLVIFLTRNPESMLVIASLCVVLLLLFYKLTIKVTDDFVEFKLGIGIINERYKMQDIQSCKSISYFPFGWGVRWRPGITLFNVSGNKAIELEIKNKSRKIWIGTDSPEEISSYINSKRN